MSGTVDKDYDILKQQYDYLKKEYDDLASRVLHTQANLQSCLPSTTTIESKGDVAPTPSSLKPRNTVFRARKPSFIPVVTCGADSGTESMVFGVPFTHKLNTHHKDAERGRSSSLGSLKYACNTDTFLKPLDATNMKQTLQPLVATTEVKQSHRRKKPTTVLPDQTVNSSIQEQGKSDKDKHSNNAVQDTVPSTVSVTSEDEALQAQSDDPGDSGTGNPSELANGENVTNNDTKNKPLARSNSMNKGKQIQRVNSESYLKNNAVGKLQGEGYSLEMVDVDESDDECIESHNFTQSCLSRARHLKKSYPVISPKSKWRQNWNLVILILLCYYTFVLPFRVGFGVDANGSWFIAETVFDFVFVLDVIGNFATGYYAKHQVLEVLILNRWMIVKHYLQTWFAIDLVSSIPIDLIVVLAVKRDDKSGGLKLTRLLRMLKLFRLLRILGMSRYFRVFSEKLKPGLLRMLKFPIFVVICAHWLACLFFWLASYDSENRDTWADDTNVRYAPIGTQYITAVYWSISTMTTVGYGDVVAKTPEEKIFSILSMLLASSMFAYFVGNMAHLISSVDATTSMYKNKMEFVREYMEYQQLPDELQQRIKLFYAHCWKRLKSFPFSEGAILDELTASLRREVVLYLNRDMVEKVPFFENQDDNFISNLILVMQLEICAPKDLIITEGDMGHCMYFLRRGMVEVCSGDCTKVYATLSDGAFFGEVSLLVSGRRTASVRAVYHCDLLRLEQDDLDRVLSDYPEAMEKVVKMAADSKYHLSSTDRELLQQRFEILQAHMTETIQPEHDDENVDTGSGTVEGYTMPTAVSATSSCSRDNLSNAGSTASRTTSRRDTNLNFHRIMDKLREKKRASQSRDGSF